MISIIPIFLPQESCPFNCLFCNQKTAVGEVRRLSGEDITRTVDSALETISEGSIIQVGFYGGSFTFIPKEQQTEYLKAVEPFIKNKNISSVRISTRPDSLNPKIISFLKSYEVATVELGVEILDDDILAGIKRGHTVDDVIRAVDLLMSNDIKTGLQLMVGLPGEDEKRRRRSFDRTLSLMPNFLRIHPTVVLQGSRLELMYREGKYKPLMLQEAVDICTDMVIAAETVGIPVIRIGLQSSCSLQEEGSIIAGPWHPSFGQIVRSEIYYRLLLKGLERLKMGKRPAEIVVECANAETLKGQKNINIENLERDYPGIKLKIKKDKTLGKNQLTIIGIDTEPINIFTTDLIEDKRG